MKPGHRKRPSGLRLGARRDIRGGYRIHSNVARASGAVSRTHLVQYLMFESWMSWSISLAWMFSLHETAICIVDEDAIVVSKALSEPADLVRCLTATGLTIECIGLEAGPLSRQRFSTMAW
jgi:hypothetical protein